MSGDMVLDELEVPSDWVTNELMKLLFLPLFLFLNMCPLLTHPLTQKNGTHMGKRRKETSFSCTGWSKCKYVFPDLCKAN